MSESDSTVIRPRPGQPTIDTSDSTIIRPRPAGQQAESDKTLIKPRRKFANSIPNDNKPSLLSPSPKRQGINIIHSSTVYDLPGLPALIRDASPLLSIVSQVKQLDGTLAVNTLRQHIIQLMQTFISQTKKQTGDSELTANASYVLCATLDEAILNTAWGENSAWSQKPILSVFHKETYGGEKFYTILDEAINNDVKNFDLIELLYLCLSLGFLGKLRIDDNGQIKADKIRANTYQVLIKNRNRYNRTLSSNIEPLNSNKKKLNSFLSIWCLFLILTLGAFWVYQQWSFTINQESDEVANELAALIPIQTEPSLPDNQTRKQVILLRQLLEQEIALGVLSVNDYLNRSTIVLQSGELFTSGSADINTAYEPILDKISKALEAIPGQIIVSGHTDSSAIRTARYPSNWHLSLARASAVGRYMSSSADLKARLLPEGRGANEPIADNATAQGRAQNRRVVIELYYTEAFPPLYSNN